MKWIRARILLIGTGCAVVLFAWNLARPREAGSILQEHAAGAPLQSVYLYAPGVLTLAAAATSSGKDTGDAAREQAVVKTALKTAEEAARQIDGQVQSARSRLADLQREATRAKLTAADAEREFERSDSLPGSGPAWQVQRSAAAAAHESAEKAFESVALRTAEAAAQADALELKARDAQRDLREAAAHSDAVEAGSDHVRLGPGRGQGWLERDCALTTGQPLMALVAVQRPDMAAIDRSQEALVVLDSDPSIVWPGRVSGISDTPVETSAGTFVAVTVVLENAQAIQFCGLPVHARLQRIQ